MEKNTSSKKSIIALVIVIILVALGYFYFSGEPTDESTSSLESENSLAAAASLADSAKIIALLNQVNAINLDIDFFKSSAFTSLVDNTVVVPEQNVGRPNPFIAVPGTFAVPQSPVVPKR
ncbi:MAG: hypothetical protein AAB895_01675 [Patescibacteria group bacterium]